MRHPGRSAWYRSSSGPALLCPARPQTALYSNSFPRDRGPWCRQRSNKRACPHCSKPALNRSPALRRHCRERCSSRERSDSGCSERYTVLFFLLALLSFSLRHRPEVERRQRASDGGAQPAPGQPCCQATRPTIESNVFHFRLLPGRAISTRCGADSLAAERLERTLALLATTGDAGDGERVGARAEGHVRPPAPQSPGLRQPKQCGPARGYDRRRTRHAARGRHAVRDHLRLGWPIASPNVLRRL
jgi:hypothetical protein